MWSRRLAEKSQRLVGRTRVAVASVEWLDRLSRRVAQAVRTRVAKHAVSRLTTEGPILDAKAITVKERLSVRDTAGEEVRKVEGDRVFALRDDGTLSANQDTVWSQSGRDALTDAAVERR